MGFPAATVPRVDYLESVDSTNAEALRRGRAGELGPLWIASRIQTAGRGRRGREWISPPGNLHATLLMNDPAAPAVAPQLGFVAALALHDAAATAAPALAESLALKWPNDVLCRGRKVAGILIESEGDPLVAAIGFGVNCRHHPDIAEYEATDLAAEGVEIEPSTLLGLLAAAMQSRLAQWDRGAGFDGIRAAWLARAGGLGGHLRVRLPGREVSGMFVTIGEAGHLVLHRADGAVEEIAAGTVFPFKSDEDRGLRE